MTAREEVRREARDHIEPELPALHRLVLGELAAHGPATGSELARQLGITILTIRPRLVELRLKGRIIETGVKRKNFNGRNEAEYRLTTEGDDDDRQPNLFA